MKQTIGFIGLSIMKLPIATNLVTAGYEVISYNTSPIFSVGGEVVANTVQRYDSFIFKY